MAGLSGSTAQVQQRVFIDTSSIEVFANEGATVKRAVVLLAAPYDSVVLHADEELGSLAGTIHELASAWN